MGQALVLDRNSCIFKYFLRAPFFAIVSDHEKLNVYLKNELHSTVCERLGQVHLPVDKTNRQLFGVVCIYRRRYSSTHSGQHLSWTHSAVPRFYHNINLEMSESSMLESWLRIARHVDASSIVHTLVNNGKLANQIAKVTASWGKITYS